LTWEFGSGEKGPSRDHKGTRKKQQSCGNQGSDRFSASKGAWTWEYIGENFNDSIMNQNRKELKKAKEARREPVLVGSEEDKLWVCVHRRGRWDGENYR